MGISFLRNEEVSSEVSNEHPKPRAAERGHALPIRSCLGDVCCGFPVPLNEAFCLSPRVGLLAFLTEVLCMCLHRSGPQRTLVVGSTGCVLSLWLLVADCSAFPSLLPTIRAQLVDAIVSTMFSLLSRTSLGCCCGFQQCRSLLGHVWSLFVMEGNSNVSVDLAELSDVSVA